MHLVCLPRAFINTFFCLVTLIFELLIAPNSAQYTTPNLFFQEQCLAKTTSVATYSPLHRALSFDHVVAPFALIALPIVDPNSITLPQSIHEKTLESGS